MSGDGLSLEAAVAQYLAARDDLVPSSERGYRAALNELKAAFPGAPLSVFEPAAAGRNLIKGFLDNRWGDAASATYKKSQTLLRAHPDPRDQVPLRLLLTAGLPKEALRHVRFADVNAVARTVTYIGRRKVQTQTIDDPAFWEQYDALRIQRRAADDEYILPAQTARKYDPTAYEVAAMERDGVIDAAGTYLYRRHDGRWFRAVVRPTEPQADHGPHLWWYRCLRRAGLVPPVVKTGFPMQSARYTFGRRRYTERGSLRELQHELGGLTRAGTVSDVYKNQDADYLDEALRRALLRVPISGIEATPTAIGLDGTAPPRGWWKQPIRTFATYVADERDLIELSRVSVEMLRVEDTTSERLHEAAETLTRAVSAAELVERARAAPLGDAADP